MTPVEANQCALHDMSQRWNEQRWEEQVEKNRSIQACLDGLRCEIASIKMYIAIGIGVMASVQVMAPIFFRIIGIK